ncbi:2Fe-2S iron-sulfur cluster-binding protein [Arthrobacter sp. P2b]|uniref:2Fe-2S iron-sulfur cluster-binding protein n=1 Tax=Arthrobacter sp. P2b TaxID=1938741 RepID=UPI0026DA7C35|nr:2Fe-2S iron-sulfur cluster-binding protein [Arthrobacter sp. P2b]
MEYRQFDGRTQAVDVPPGQSIMDAAVRNNVPGIIAECGGSCACGTCHVYLIEETSSTFGPPTDAEAELLEFAEGRESNSRLSCQLVIGRECTKVCVSVPEP